MKVWINGRDHETDKVELSYGDLVELAHKPANPSTSSMTLYTVTYSHRKDGSSGRLVGSLIPGEAVWLRDGMVINVAHTGSA